jgi:hypothetical protein
MAKFLPNKHGNATYGGAAMCPAQIAKSGWHKIRHAISPQLLFYNIASKCGLIYK